MKYRYVQEASYAFDLFALTFPVESDDHKVM